MDAEAMIHRLLHLAMLEIRIASHEAGDKKVFKLADLFHNVPLQLQRVARGDGSPEEVLQWLRTRAREAGCERWLEGAMTNSPAAESPAHPGGPTRPPAQPLVAGDATS